MKNKSIWIERTLSTYANIYFVMDQQLDSITLKSTVLFQGSSLPIPITKERIASVV